MLSFQLSWSKQIFLFCLFYQTRRVKLTNTFCKSQPKPQLQLSWWINLALVSVSTPTNHRTSWADSNVIVRLFMSSFNFLNSGKIKFCYILSFYGRCLQGIGHHNVMISLCPLSICHATVSRHLIGQRWECYIVEEVIEVDEFDKGRLN